MEKILFKKIELWVLGVLAVFGFFGMVLFGAIVLDEERGEEELGGDHFGVIGDAALALAELPENARQSLRQLGRPDSTMMATPSLPKNYSIADGWFWARPPGSNGLNGFVLLSRYDGDRARSIVELVSLGTGQTLRVWSPKPETFLTMAMKRPEYDRWVHHDLWKNEYFRFVHPYLNTAGDLLAKDHDTPLFLLSPCGNVKWVQDEHLFHHSANSDGEGGYWVPGLAVNNTPQNVSNSFRRDALVRVNADGAVIYKEALDDVFRRNGMRHLLSMGNHFYFDPMHLNDIEPVLADGLFWTKGDLFLSIRNPSLVALYRPSTGRIVWSKAGPWLTQHDVDIVDPQTIAVFNNNAYNYGLGPYVDGPSEVLFYDFGDQTVKSPLRDKLEELDILASTEGLQDITPSGHLILEETTRGRLFIFNNTGKLVASFLNRAENGQVYTLGWSRYIPQAHGDKALAAIEKSGC